MEKTYTQLTLEERIEIYRLHAGGISLRKIALALGRNASTISRELKRNSRDTKAWKDGYAPVRAEVLKERRRRRGRGHKLALQPELQAYVKERLVMGWSPEQIAGRLEQEHGHAIISHEAIYRFIYHRCANKKYDWSRLLPRKQVKRKTRKERGWKPEEKIKHRVSIAERPEYINVRSCPGHWEADTMMFRNPAHVALVACERISRLLKITAQNGRGAEITIANLKAFFADMPPPMRQSVTFDNGAEFTHHYRLNQQHGISTFFCNPHTPWQKGSIENAIGRLRRKLPRKTDLAALPQEVLEHYVRQYNDTPRKCLAFLTPKEAYDYAKSTVALQT